MHQHPDPHQSYPQPHRKKSSWSGLFTILLVGGLVFMGTVVLAVMISGSSRNLVSVPSDPVPQITMSASQAAKLVKPRPVKTRLGATSHTVLMVNGNGVRNTVTFTVHRDWDLFYAYDCSAEQYPGNFSVGSQEVLDGHVDPEIVNETGTWGMDVIHRHNGPGPMHLEINSACKWTIRVIQLP